MYFKCFRLTFSCTRCYLQQQNIQQIERVPQKGVFDGTINVTCCSHYLRLNAACDVEKNFVSAWPRPPTWWAITCNMGWGVVSYCIGCTRFAGRWYVVRTLKRIWNAKHTGTNRDYCGYTRSTPNKTIKRNATVLRYKTRVEKLRVNKLNAKAITVQSA